MNGFAHVGAAAAGDGAVEAKGSLPPMPPDSKDAGDPAVSAVGAEDFGVDVLDDDVLVLPKLYGSCPWVILSTARAC